MGSIARWRSVGRRKIHNHESRIALVGLELEGSRPTGHDKVLLSLGDNYSELLCTDGGRARDYELNASCRTSAAIQIATGIQCGRRFVDTKRNPSDEDSRLADTGLVRAWERFVGSEVRRIVETRGRLAPSLRRRAPGGRYSLEVCSGSGRITSSCIEAGLRIAPPIDNIHGAGFNLFDVRARREFLSCVQQGLVWIVWLALPCGLSQAQPLSEETVASHRGWELSQAL